MDWLTVDPGETTGYSIWRGNSILDLGQMPLWEFIDSVDAWLTNEADRFELTEEDVEPLGAIVCEDWQLYPWVMQTGALDFDFCRTARGIGALQLLARQHGLAFELQGAKIKEAAVAAGAEELFVTPLHENRHMNDAVMHGVFYTASHEGKAPC